MRNGRKKAQKAQKAFEFSHFLAFCAFLRPNAFKSRRLQRAFYDNASFNAWPISFWFEAPD
jgi:hypothetical protein